MFSSKGWNPLATDLEQGYGDFEPDVRRGFIRKVFGLLCLQLLLTTCIGGLVVGVSAIRNYFFENPWLFWLVFFASFAFIVVLTCVPDLANKHPQNIILLFAFTGCEGILVGASASCYDLNEVILAAGITVCVTAGLTLFAMQTKLDFTLLSGGLFAALVVFVLMIFMFAVFPASNTLGIVLSSLGALLFSVYLVYDVQLIVGGGKYELGPDDYVVAALRVYLDIVNIFIYILNIIGRSN